MCPISELPSAMNFPDSASNRSGAFVTTQQPNLVSRHALRTYSAKRSVAQERWSSIAAQQIRALFFASTVSNNRACRRNSASRARPSVIFFLSHSAPRGGIVGRTVVFQTISKIQSFNTGLCLDNVENLHNLLFLLLREFFLLRYEFFFIFYRFRQVVNPCRNGKLTFYFRLFQALMCLLNGLIFGSRTTLHPLLMSAEGSLVDFFSLSNHHIFAGGKLLWASPRGNCAGKHTAAYTVSSLDIRGPLRQAVGATAY
ncbi:hypothetical protein AGDE_16310 [Angomonas deanei]|uniref:Uncharacterized protein n=1 Tax=Angomonas deanei TaxID=59799 RepID=A0A7G2CAI2_9TRYP|nr:hypothetical protein AGDE_16310 [Angomonas deanei]CAD2216465.1 hypothetical protein, conserved [Angomonas deanei]|eukprot:EPY17331.1 hypothetical protein AGDE_16310 [Angomonas deanei]